MLVTVSYKKLAVASTTDPNLIAYYNADVVTASDYYPFGMTMPGRKFTQANSSYRYGFNGKEKSSEITSDDYDYGARIYDSRLGRWLSLDPLMEKYPSLSPYNYTANNPIWFLDPDGKKIFVYYKVTNSDGSTKMLSAQYKGGKLVDKKGNEVVTTDPFANAIVSTLNNISKTKHGNTVVTEILNSKTEVKFTNEVGDAGSRIMQTQGNKIYANGVVQGKSDANKADMIANELFGVYTSMVGEKKNDLNKEFATFVFGNAIAKADRKSVCRERVCSTV